MSASNKGTVVLGELKDFLGFLQGMWGILAGVSVLFPLSNSLAKVIPLKEWGPGGALLNFSPQLVTIVTTLVALFVILATFGQRDAFRTRTKRRVLQQQAWPSFVVAILALIIYVGIYSLVANGFFMSQFGWGYETDPRWLLTDVLLLLSYSIFFALMTRAFVLLGMLEYFGKEE
ncbi:MAG: hypothetical protein HY782_29000 [Chloroflexi bacterium]|nr:hypothetical protein [Chloroflexota bacterium]